MADTDHETLRVDARRNRERLLDAATALFASRGVSVSTHEIARRAGVSTGTLSRHFPTKTALIAAVLLELLNGLAAEARAHATADDPGAAFYGVFTKLIVEGTANRALFDALASAGADSSLKAAVSPAGRELDDALGALLARAQGTGAVRADITQPELLALLAGALTAQAHLGDGAPSALLIRATCDGLRPIDR
jgi:AcrR family transcriptional regulator